MDEPPPPHQSQEQQQPPQGSQNNAGTPQHHSVCTLETILNSAPFQNVTGTVVETYWNLVKPKLVDIYSRMENNTSRTRPPEWNTLYTATAAFCDNSNDAEKRQIHRMFRAYLQDIINSHISHLELLSGHAFLYEYIRRWEFNCTFGSLLRRIFHHLQEFWIFENENLHRLETIRPLDQLVVCLWRENVLTQCHSLVDIAIDIVNSVRRGTNLDLDIVRRLVDHILMLGIIDCDRRGELRCEDFHRDSVSTELLRPENSAAFNLYQQLFEDPFVVATAEFYGVQVINKGRPRDIATLVDKILTLIHHDANTVSRFLRPESMPRVQRATEAELIGIYVDYLEQEVIRMLKNSDFLVLDVAFRLLKRNDKAYNNLRSHFTRLIRDQGNTIMVKHASSAPKKDEMRHHMDLMGNLTVLHYRYSRIVTLYFNKDRSFHAAIDDAFRGFINRSMGKISLPVILAHYLNQFLTVKHPSAQTDQFVTDSMTSNNSDNANNDENDRTGPTPNENVPSDQVNLASEQAPGENEIVHKLGDARVRLGVLDELVRFCFYLDDKDTFCDANRRLFARRLLTRYDLDLETRFLKRLDAAVGGIYTQRFRGMLQDMATSKELTTGYAKFVQERKAPPIPKDTKTEVSISNIKEETNECVQDLAVGDKELKQEPSADLPSAQEDVSDEHSKAEPKLASSTVESPPEVVKTLSSGVKLDALTRAALDLDTSVLVLNQLHWPPSSGLGLRIPDLLKKSQELFHEYYMQNKESRKLTWAYGMSTIEMGANFGGRNYTMKMSTCQGCILLLFNKRDVLTLDEIGNLLNVKRDEVWEQIRPFLFEKKCRLFRTVAEDAINTGKGQKRSRSMMEGEDKNDHADDGECVEIDATAKLCLSRYAGRGLQVNEGFHSEMTQINVPSTVEIVDVATAVSTKEAVADRNTQIDSVVVRVMKSEKRMTHVELSGQAIKLLSPYFQPDAHLLKSRIERLIELEYIRRDEEDARVYHYCA